MSPEILLTKKWVDVEVMVGEVMASPSVSYTVLFHWWSAVAVAKARQNTSDGKSFMVRHRHFISLACICLYVRVIWLL